VTLTLLKVDVKKSNTNKLMTLIW